MYVFPVFFQHHQAWLYLLILIAFWIAGYFFTRFLKHSLRNGPKYGRKPFAPPTRTVNRPPSASPSRTANRPPPAPPAPSAPSSRTVNRPFSVPQPDFYPKLLSICFGDKAKAERLVQFELNKDPRCSRSDAIKRAVERVQYDKR